MKAITRLKGWLANKNTNHDAGSSGGHGAPAASSQELHDNSRISMQLAAQDRGSVTTGGSGSLRNSGSLTARNPPLHPNAPTGQSHTTTTVIRSSPSHIPSREHTILFQRILGNIDVFAHFLEWIPSDSRSLLLFVSQMEQFSETIEHLSTSMLLNQLEKVMNVYLTPSSPMSVTTYLEGTTLPDILRAYAALLTLISPQASPLSQQEAIAAAHKNSNRPQSPEDVVTTDGSVSINEIGTDVALMSPVASSDVALSAEEQKAKDTEVVIQRMILLAALERSRQELQDRLVVNCLPAYLDYVSSEKFKASAKAAALQACNPQTATSTLTGSAAAVAASTNSNSQLRFECVLEDPLAYVSFFLFLHNDGISKQLTFWYELENANALALAIFQKATSLLNGTTSKRGPNLEENSVGNSAARAHTQAAANIDVPTLEKQGLLAQLTALITCLSSAAVIRTNSSLPPVNVDELCEPPSGVDFHPPPRAISQPTESNIMQSAIEALLRSSNPKDTIVSLVTKSQVKTLSQLSFEELVIIAKVVQLLLHIAQQFKSLYLKHVSFDLPPSLNKLVGESTSRAMTSVVENQDEELDESVSQITTGTNVSQDTTEDDYRSGRAAPVRVSRMEEACARLSLLLAEELTILSDVVDIIVPICRVLRHLHIKLERQLRWQVWPSFWASPIYFEYCRLAKPNEKVGIPLYVQIERVLQLDENQGGEDSLPFEHDKSTSDSRNSNHSSGSFTSAASILASATVTAAPLKVKEVDIDSSILDGSELPVQVSGFEEAHFSSPEAVGSDSDQLSQGIVSSDILSDPVSSNSQSTHLSSASFDSFIINSSASPTGTLSTPDTPSNAFQKDNTLSPTAQSPVSKGLLSPANNQAVTKASLKNLLFGRSFLSYLKKSPSLNNCVIIECRSNEINEKSRLRSLALEHVPKHILKSRAEVLKGEIVERISSRSPHVGNQNMNEALQDAVKDLIDTGALFGITAKANMGTSPSIADLGLTKSPAKSQWSKQVLLTAQSESSSASTEQKMSHSDVPVEETQNNTSSSSLLDLFSNVDPIRGEAKSVNVPRPSDMLSRSYGIENSAKDLLSKPWSRPLLDHVVVIRGVPRFVADEISRRKGADKPLPPSATKTRYLMETVMQVPSSEVAKAEDKASMDLLKKKRRIQKLKLKRMMQGIDKPSPSVGDPDYLDTEEVNEEYLETWSRIILPGGIADLAFPHNAIDPSSSDSSRITSFSGPNASQGYLSAYGRQSKQADHKMIAPMDAAATEWFSAVSQQASFCSRQVQTTKSILASEWEASIPLFDPIDSQNSEVIQDKSPIKKKPKSPTTQDLRLSRSNSMSIPSSKQFSTLTPASASAASSAIATSVASSPFTSLTTASAKALGSALKMAAAEAACATIPPFLPERIFPFVLKEADGSRIFCAVLHVLGEEIYERGSAQVAQYEGGDECEDPSSQKSILQGSDFIPRPPLPAVANNVIDALGGEDAIGESAATTPFSQQLKELRRRPDHRIAYAVILVSSVPLVQLLLDALTELGNDITKFSHKLPQFESSSVSDPTNGFLVRLNENKIFKTICALTNPLSFTPNLYGLCRPPPPSYLPIIPPRLYVPPLDIYSSRAFTAMHPSRLVMTLEMALSERKIIVLSKDIGLLSYVIEVILALMYPFSWPYPVISVLPLSMFSMLQCPTPFLIGIWTGHRNAALQNIQSSCFVVDLDQDETFYTTLKNGMRKPSVSTGFLSPITSSVGVSSNSQSAREKSRLPPAPVPSSPHSLGVELIMVPPQEMPPKIPRVHRLRIIRALNRCFMARPASCDRPEAAVSKITFLSSKVHPVAALRLESLIVWTNILCGYRNFVYILPALPDGLASVSSPPIAIFDTDGFINFKSDGAETSTFLRSLLKTMLFPNLLHARLCTTGLQPAKFLPAVSLAPPLSNLQWYGIPEKDVIQLWSAAATVQTDDAFDRLEMVACGQREILFDIISNGLAQAYVIRGAKPGIDYDGTATCPDHVFSPTAGQFTMRDHVTELMDVLSVWNASSKSCDSWSQIADHVQKAHYV